jgi:DNA-binding transcriptional LysR family regulator
MNLASIDLNLLVAFEALFDTRSVTLAGQRLNRAQPSVSNALGRLRTLFDDPLFVRSSEGMVPTERAMALMPGIAQALETIRQALSQDVAFDPGAARGRRFTIAASDYADIVLVPYIVALLRREAPDADLRVAALDRASIYAQLDQSTVDVAIGGHLAPPKRMRAEALYQETFVCMADRRHPLLRRRASRAADRIDLATYLGLPHALFVPSNDGSARGVIDARLDRLRKQRRVAATFAHIVALPYAVLGTDLVATLAGRVASRLAPAGTVIRRLPAELDDTAFSIDMVHGPRSEGDAAGAWLRGRVRAAVSEMNAAAKLPSARA